MKKYIFFTFIFMINIAAFASETDTTHYKKNNVIFMPEVYLKSNSAYYYYSLYVGYERNLTNKVKIGTVLLYNTKYTKFFRFDGFKTERTFGVSLNGYYNILHKKVKNELWLGVSAILLKQDSHTKVIFDPLGNLTNNSDFYTRFSPRIEIGYAMQYFYNINRTYGIGIYHTSYWQIVHHKLDIDWSTFLLSLKKTF